MPLKNFGIIMKLPPKMIEDILKLKILQLASSNLLEMYMARKA